MAAVAAHALPATSVAVVAGVQAIAPVLFTPVSTVPVRRVPIVTTIELPDCTMCRDACVKRQARYDSGYTAADNGPWTYLCPQHYLALSSQQLGLGLGQYLMTHDELTPELRAAVRRAGEYWSALGVGSWQETPWADDAAG